MAEVFYCNPTFDFLIDIKAEWTFSDSLAETKLRPGLALEGDTDLF